MSIVFVLGTAALLIAADQLLKIWVLDTLAGGPSRMLIPGFLQLTYVENRGAAFGIFQGRVGLLSIFTVIVIAAIAYLLIRGKFNGNKLIMWCSGLLIAGGIGNLIDRLFRGFVVDYLDISPLFYFPVFNLADCCVVVGTFLIMIYFLFFENKKGKALPVSENLPSEGEHFID